MTRNLILLRLVIRVQEVIGRLVVSLEFSSNILLVLLIIPPLPMAAVCQAPKLSELVIH